MLQELPDRQPRLPMIPSRLCIAALATLLAAAAPKLPRVVSVTPMGVVAQTPLVVLRDGTYSTRIGNYAYWSFNDTGMTTRNDGGNNFIDNSVSWSTSLDARHGITLDADQTGPDHVPVRFIPFTPAEAQFQREHDPAHCTTTDCGENLALWGGGIVYDSASGTVIQPFGEVIRGGPISGFQGVGAGLAVGTVLPNGYLKLARPVQNPGHAHPALMWGADEQAFADQAVILNGYYYAYGAAQSGLVLNVVLARVPLAHLLDKADWTYYAGHGIWSTDVADCAPLFEGGSAGSSIFYDDYLKEWMTIYTGVFSNKLYYRVGAAPEGPWSDQALLLTGAPGTKGTVDYSGKAHPEYSPDHGRTIYVTYVHNPAQYAQDLPLSAVVFAPAE